MFNVPKLRFGEFEGDWVEKRLDSLFKITAGGDIKSKNISLFKTNKFKYPIYANAEKNKGFYGYSDIFKINENVITVAGRGVNIGIAHVRNHKFYPIVRLLVLNPLLDIDIYFFEYQINKINIFMESTGVPQLTAPQVSIYRVFYPLKIEQQKISTFLNSIDQKIEQLSKKKTLLENYKKGLMQKIFSQEIRFSPTLVPTLSVGTSSGFDDWKEKRLGDIATFSKGKGISKSNIIENGKIKCIRYGELYTYYNETISDIKSSTNLDIENLVLSQYNDIIIPASGETQIDIATASCVLKDNIALSGDLNIIRTNENGVFLAYYLNNFKRFDIAKLAQGVSVVHLYTSQLKQLKLNLPSLKEQQKIATFLTSIDQKITQNNQTLEQMKAFKKGLLQQMFV